MTALLKFSIDRIALAENFFVLRNLLLKNNAILLDCILLEKISEFIGRQMRKRRLLHGARTPNFFSA